MKFISQMKGKIMNKLLHFTILTILISCAHHSGSKKDYKHLKKAIAGDHREEENKIRDTYRHPSETLTFFNVKPNHKVLEITPGGGWYTEILGPYLKKEGELVLAIFDDNAKSELYPRLNKILKGKISAHPEKFGNISYSILQAPEKIKALAPENSMDRVLTFRNVHNWMKYGGVKAVFKEMYKALKPGGILGVVEHRESFSKKQDPKALNGYVREDYIIKLAEEAGFEFISKSEVNANYNDNKNHPKGVWTLPPSLRLKNKNRRKYLAIGESDRMTIQFRKPVK